MVFIRFEWNEAKAAANLKKHGVSFETAVRAFDDPFAGKGNAMKKTDAKTVRYDVDLANLPQGAG
jgi:uncharacterized DUF497 family protein